MHFSPDDPFSFMNEFAENVADEDGMNVRMMIAHDEDGVSGSRVASVGMRQRHLLLVTTSIRQSGHRLSSHHAPAIMTTAVTGDMSVLQALDLHLRRWKRSYDSRRKVFILIFVLLLLLYFVHSIVRWIWSPALLTIDDQSSILEKQLFPFAVEEQQFNTFIHRSWSKGSAGNSPVPTASPLKQFTPFVGNGKLGLDVDQDASFWIRGRRGLEQKLPFFPVVVFHPLHSQLQSASVVRFVEGVVHRLSAFPYVGSTVTISETFYSHRLISSLLLQEIQVNNPSEVPLILTVLRTGWKGKSSLKSEQFRVKNKVQYQLSEGEIRAFKSNFVNGFVIVCSALPDTVEVPAKSRRTFVYRTYVNYTSPTPQTRASAALAEVKHTLQETVKKVEEIPVTSLYNYHTEAWRNLWKPGFGISYSLAEGALNGDSINATIYYILSQKLSFATDLNILSAAEYDDSRTSFLLNHPDRCYAGNPTLQAPNLWLSLQTLADMQTLVNRWLLTLEKNGCHNLVMSGAEGTMQAVIMSFVGMQFHQRHLEMGIHPKELHRDYFLRRVRFSNRTAINVTMSVGEDNKASIFVILDKNAEKQDFYACDAGCLDAPVVLKSTEWKQLPVKITEPLTAILYITPDQQHIAELKHAIHVQEVAVAPPHEHQLIAMHRHGHRLGGLPAMFWGAIIILIVIFHLFLAKLIYSEYLAPGSASLSAGYERVRRTV